MQCATLSVPLDYAEPAGRHIRIALAEVPATSPPNRRAGLLVVDPGGPGAPGRGLAGSIAAALPANLAARYDIIGFDPRGVGASVPSMHCDPGFFSSVRPYYVPGSTSDENAMEARARDYARDCQARYGWLLPYMTTQDTARDLDALRVAMHQRTISYFGFSYGTYIGQVYATLFPRHVGRLVLDSIVDPAGVWWQDNLDQDIAGQARLEQMFAWIARYNSTYHLGPSPSEVASAYVAARARLEAHPVGVLGPDELDDTFVAGLYTDSLWSSLASALSRYVHGGGAGALTSMYLSAGVQSENEFAVYNAVECTDAAWPRKWSVWDSTTRRVYERAPFLAWDNTWFNAACAFWPVKGPAEPPKVGALGLPGILMLQGTGDVATPYAGALEARALFPSARMVVVRKEGNHGQFLSFPPNRCVDGYVDRYLSTGALPRSRALADSSRALVDATCPAAPLPSPGS